MKWIITTQNKSADKDGSRPLVSVKGIHDGGEIEWVLNVDEFRALQRAVLWTEAGNTVIRKCGCVDTKDFYQRGARCERHMRSQREEMDAGGQALLEG